MHRWGGGRERTAVPAACRVSANKGLSAAAAAHVDGVEATSWLAGDQIRSKRQRVVERRAVGLVLCIVKLSAQTVGTHKSSAAA